jgi:hypothetical protein
MKSSYVVAALVLASYFVMKMGLTPRAIWTLPSKRRPA